MLSAEIDRAEDFAGCRKTDRMTPGCCDSKALGAPWLACRASWRSPCLSIFNEQGQKKVLKKMKESRHAQLYTRAVEGRNGNETKNGRVCLRIKGKL